MSRRLVYFFFFPSPRVALNWVKDGHIAAIPCSDCRYKGIIVQGRGDEGGNSALYGHCSEYTQRSGVQFAIESDSEQIVIPGQSVHLRWERLTVIIKSDLGQSIVNCQEWNAQGSWPRHLDTLTPCRTLFGRVTP